VSTICLLKLSAETNRNYQLRFFSFCASHTQLKLVTACLLFATVLTLLLSSQQNACCCHAQTLGTSRTSALFLCMRSNILRSVTTGDVIVDQGHVQRGNNFFPYSICCRHHHTKRCDLSDLKTILFCHIGKCFRQFRSILWTSSDQHISKRNLLSTRQTNEWS